MNLDYTHPAGRRAPGGAARPRRSSSPTTASAPAAQAAVDRAAAGGKVVLLENLRFHPEEEKNDPAFAAQLAAPANVYVNDAFGSSHRAHASVEAITKLLPQPAAGLLMEKEVEYLGHALGAPGAAVRRDPRRRQGVGQDRGDREPARQGGRAGHRRRDGLHVPQVARPADRQVAGRGRQARGGADDHRPRARARRDAGAAGRSRRRRRSWKPARRTQTHRRGRCVDRRTDGRGHRPQDGGAVPAAWWRTRRRWSGTARWASSRCRRSTRAPTRWRKAVAAVNGTTIVGGGDSVSAVSKAGVADRITHISTGGGASLEFLGGRVLPGVAALANK